MLFVKALFYFLIPRNMFPKIGNILFRVRDTNTAA